MAVSLADLTRVGRVSFTGFPVAALDFYDDLEMDNTKSFWEAHKRGLQGVGRGAMKALIAALEPEFGDGEGVPPLPRRPLRQGQDAVQDPPGRVRRGRARAPAGTSRCRRAGVRTGAGFYAGEGAQIAADRTAVAEERRGAELEGILAGLAAEGYEISGEQLKTAPRGYDREHPRIDLLRHKQLFAGRDLGFEPVVHTGELLDLVRDDWRAYRPMVEWLQRT